ncbi:MAG: IclR family transcriptional regulator [Alphaproteobacteria bacterium]|nr:IclR family transcriptional regulator [Alphaproteobacteria bacterium]
MSQDPLRLARPAVPPAYTIAAVDRAIALLELLADHPHAGVTQLAKLAGSTKSQVFRLLHTLERRRFVRKDNAQRSYALGLGALLLGERARLHTDLIRLAQGHLDALADATRENIYLTIRDGLSAVCVDMRHSPQPLRLYAEVGRAAPLHVGGGPKLLLAFAPDEVIEAVLKRPLTRFTNRTEVSAASLRRALAAIRQAGANESHGDLDSDAFSFAAPVRDLGGGVIAALSIAGPNSRLTQAAATRYRALVASHASALSRELGAPPVVTPPGAPIQLATATRAKGRRS